MIIEKKVSVLHEQKKTNVSFYAQVEKCQNGPTLKHSVYRRTGTGRQCGTDSIQCNVLPRHNPVQT